MYQAIIIYVPAAEDWFVICSGWCCFHSLPYETGPVVSQDIVDPPWQGLVTVAGHLRALLSVLKVKRDNQVRTCPPICNSVISFYENTNKKQLN